MRNDLQLNAMADRFCGQQVQYQRHGRDFTIGDTFEELTSAEYHRLQRLNRITASNTLCTVEGFAEYEAQREDQNQRNIRENLDYWRDVMANPTDENLYKFTDWARTREWSDPR